MHPMRVGSPARAATVANERMADQVLDHLKGYVRRQDSARADKSFFIALLEEWDSQVETLQWRVRALEAELAESRQHVRALEWRLATAPWRRFAQYVRFVAGFGPWPS